MEEERELDLMEGEREEDVVKGERKVDLVEEERDLDLVKREREWYLVEDMDVALEMDRMESQDIELVNLEAYFSDQGIRL